MLGKLDVLHVLHVLDQRLDALNIMFVSILLVY